MLVLSTSSTEVYGKSFTLTNAPRMFTRVKLLGVANLSYEDWDNVNTNGLFMCENGSQHAPSIGALTGLQISNGVNGHQFQISFRANNGEIHYRFRTNRSENFSSWYKVTVVAI